MRSIKVIGIFKVSGIIIDLADLWHIARAWVRKLCEREIRKVEQILRKSNRQRGKK
jgi:hypothetical protein